MKMKSYYKPTPVRMRKLGDALLGVSLIGIPAELSGYTWVSLSLFAFGIIGKFLTNFFTEDNGQDNTRKN